jgi:uncharacterized membrane protein YfcA
MTVATALALLAAGIGGGLASTIASVASTVSYPILLSLGLPPLSANVTNTVSLVLTGLGSVLGSRPELAGQRARVIRLGLVTACGGGTGGALLDPARGRVRGLDVHRVLRRGGRGAAARRLPVRALRLFIAAVGFVLAVKLALSAYR